MSELAIRVESVGKKYRIGAKQEKYKTLRDMLANSISSPVQKLTSIAHGKLKSNGHSSKESDQIIWALKDVSFEVKQGDVVGIIGHNGAGKSTLLKILSRISEPTTGEAEIHGRVGSLLEVGTGFHPELTGRENLYLNGAILGMKRQEINQKFDEIVDFSGVEQFIDTPVKFYSSGMYLRLAFGVAAHLEPDILLVDEVLAVGDSAFQKKCLGKMETVASQGRTVLFVSHNMATVLNLCSKCILIERGRIAKFGEASSVVDQYHESADRASEIPLAERRDRSGNQALRFTKLRFNGPQSLFGPSNLVSGQAAAIIMEYESKDHRHLKNIEIDLKIMDQRGNFLFTCSTRFQNKALQELPPASELVFNIPQLPLAPGLYRIDLWSEVRGQEADCIKGAAQFSVDEGDFYGNGKLPVTRKHGSVLVGHSLHVGRTVSQVTSN
jgi:homopolymeric O-antigen transport system ATP-binding protein